MSTKQKNETFITCLTWPMWLRSHKGDIAIQLMFYSSKYETSSLINIIVTNTPAIISGSGVIHTGMSDCNQEDLCYSEAKTHN